MPNLRLDFHRVSVGNKEVQAVGRALKAGQLGGDGKLSRRVERLLVRRLGVGRAFLTPSCSAALELALMALELKAGDEVILPSFNFVSGANAVLRLGCRPVFADVDIKTLCLDPRDVRRRLTRRTKAVLLTHYAGLACDMDAFLQLKRRHGLAVIEDTALGLGASFRGAALGSLGDLGCFSFHASKQITCGEGGALVTSRLDLGRKIEVIREKGTDRAAFLRGERDRYTWRALGASHVLPDLLAAMLEVQLAKEPGIRRSLVAAWKAYAKGLQPLAARGLISLPQPSAWTRINGWIFWLLLEGPWAGRRDEVLRLLKKRGVPATFHYVPLHDSPFGRKLYPGKLPLLPVTLHADRNLIRLPMHAGLSTQDCAAVCREVERILA